MRGYMMKKIILLLLIALSASEAWSAPRTVMVQMFEWPWKDIARECETYLGPIGISAVQISPPNEHISLGENKWWERYQPVSYKIQSRSGDENEFRDMVQRCRKAGVDIYADVVLNHMAAIKEGGHGFAGTAFNKYNHPGLYSPADFHYCGLNGHNGVENYKNRYEVQFCELLGLADLKTESEYVRNTLADYLNHLLDLGVAGFRVDAAKHIPADDLATILGRAKRQVYSISETFIGYDEPVAISEYIPFSDVNFFPYAFDVGGAIQNSSLQQLPSSFIGYPDSRKTVVFLENHDIQRAQPPAIPNVHQNLESYKLAHVLMMTWPYGYPQLFSGYSFSNFDQGPPILKDGWTAPVLDPQGNCRKPWNCEHRLPWMAALVRFRNETNKAFYASSIWNHEKDRLAFSRGPAGFVAINLNPSAWHSEIPTELPDGHYCDVLSGGFRSPEACRNWIEVRSGKAKVKLAGRSAIVLLPTAGDRRL